MYRPEVDAVSGQYNSQPPIAWRYSGNQMKRWRTKANVSREELAAASNYSPDTIKSMEQGVRMPTPRALEVADELCRAEGLLSDSGMDEKPTQPTKLVRELKGRNPNG
ncbi:helix-turn-helix domain-containing protein [Streptomyces sp. NPDC002787]